ncbi:hypothetical protein FF38_01078 [Lucilia cuprina]|uniref:F-box domain-containing protein n=1 Tax=Lucilia cuprina TaxID=7375 RepID=A0A0L0CEY4_LUCCU|nr:hypothetical protein FF38_01078 [Lucilia cuprina]
MEIQQLEILDQVISNPYLLANIFKYTNLQTQLKLAKICNYFQNVIAFPNIRKLCIENCFGDSFKAPILRKENVPSDIFELLRVFIKTSTEIKI